MYTLVLTHDIDYLSLKEIPWFCRTLWGFSYRCFLAAFTSKLGTRSFRRRARVLWDGISMPLIKLGWRSDPWASSLEQMIEIEKHLGVRSTIYFLPFPNQPGSTPAGMAAPYNRTSFYDVGDHSEMLRLLESEGWEIGLHGINAYWDESSALEEKGKIEEILGHDNIGIRMHWLYYNHQQTWSLLSRVGFRYDATHGWNEKVGFPDGQYAPFFPIENQPFQVLPLNIQDQALFDHLGLSDAEAWTRVLEIFDIAKQHEGIVTVLWHNYSFAPPFFWGGIYERIIRQAQSDGAQIMRAIDAVRCNEINASREHRKLTTIEGKSNYGDNLHSDNGTPSV